MLTANLLDTYPILSDQISRAGLSVVLGQLEQVMAADIPGAIVEFGCYIGTTSVFIRRLLDGADQSDKREFHVYDSFLGLPPKSAQDSSTVGAAFQEGELNVSRKQLFSEFHKARLQTPVVHKGWFSELTDKDVPPKLAFAFLDGDFYKSIRDSLQLAWPRLSPGGIICIDDYGREALPGVQRAVHDYFQGRTPEVRVSHNIGTIRKAAL
jgi:O-methyltransferase